MKKLLFIFLIIFAVGCSSTPVKPVVVDPVGRQFPTPHYSLQDMRGYGLGVVFYYTTYQEIKDLDGTVIQKPIYLDMLKINDIPKGSRTVLTIEILNQKQKRYALWERVQLIKQDSKTNIPDARGGRLAVSNLGYRQYVYELPTSPDIKSVNYGIDIIGEDGSILMHVGDFNYLVSGSSFKVSNNPGEQIIHNVKGGGGISEKERKQLDKN